MVGVYIQARWSGKWYSISVSWAPICLLIERFNEREKSHDLFLFLGGKEIEKGPKIM
jgi:hypothetical protein